MQTLEESFKAQTAAYELQRAKFEALRNALGNYGNFKYVNFYDFLDPNNQNWQDYTYKTPGGLSQGRVSSGTPIGKLIQQLRDAENIDDVNEQLKIWKSYNPLDSSDNGISYIRYFMPGFGAYRNTPSIGSKPVFPTENESNPGQTTGGVQGAQAGAQAGNNSGATQGAQVGAQTGGTSGTQGMKTGGTGGTFASPGVAKGGTKTIGYGYDPNPGNVSLAYVMRNAPEQERRDALINKWNRENGRESVPYVPGTEIPAGSLNRSSSTYTSPGISTGGTYATGEGIKDANGNVLTNPGGDWEYQYALKNPQYGLGMMGKMSDAQRNYLQAVSDDMGYNYNFKGATRFV